MQLFRGILSAQSQKIKISPQAIVVHSNYVLKRYSKRLYGSVEAQLASRLPCGADIFTKDPECFNGN